MKKTSSIIKFNRLLMAIVLGFVSWVFANLSLGDTLVAWYVLASITTGMMSMVLLITSIVGE